MALHCCNITISYDIEYGTLIERCHRDSGDLEGTIICPEHKIWVCSKCEIEFKYCPYCGKSSTDDKKIDK